VAEQDEVPVPEGGPDARPAGRARTASGAGGPAARSGIARRREAARTEGNPVYLQRRKELVDAAALVFKAKGLQGANLGDIAAAAGADRASLYYYVASKEELFHEVVREAVEANVVAGRAVRDGAGTAPEKLRTLLVALMQSYADHYPILYVFIQENLTHVPDEHAGWARDMRRLNKEYEQIVIDLVQAGYDEGTMRPGAPAWVVAYGVLGMVAWTNRWFNPDESSQTAAQIGASFADTLLQGLEVAPARRAPSG
jgi:AcrR family transcriptional regulator